MARMRTSIYGRRFGLSSTGGFIAAITATGGVSSSFEMLAQMWGAPMVNTTTSTGGATIGNSGITMLNSSAVAPTFLIAAPVTGVRREIYNLSTVSTTITFGGTSTSQVFVKIGGLPAGSTTMTLDGANLCGHSIVMRGLSATQWGIVNASTVALA